MFDHRTMNRLPSVLQKEIWEYVRGDRAFWKQQFESCLDGVVNPTNIKRDFEETVADLIDPSTFPIHPTDDWKFGRTQLVHSEYYRMQSAIEFVNGRWSAPGFDFPDVFEGFVFNDFQKIPDFIDVKIGDRWVTRLTPRKGKILIPNFGLPLAHVSFVASGPEPTFSCSVITGAVENVDRIWPNFSRLWFTYRRKKTCLIRVPDGIRIARIHGPSAALA
jgi:hypothetical protein